MPLWDRPTDPDDADRWLAELQQAATDDPEQELWNVHAVEALRIMGADQWLDVLRETDMEPGHAALLYSYGVDRPFRSDLTADVEEIGGEYQLNVAWATRAYEYNVSIPLGETIPSWVFESIVEWLDIAGAEMYVEQSQVL